MELLDTSLPFEAQSLKSYKVLIKNTREITCRIVSDSMEPLIRIGDRVRVECVDTIKSIKPFDIVIFLNQDKLFCHFVWNISIGEKSAQILTRSLKNPHHNDLPTTPDQILGRVLHPQLSRRTRLWLILKTLFKNSQ